MGPWIAGGNAAQPLLELRRGDGEIVTCLQIDGLTVVVVQIGVGASQRAGGHRRRARVVHVVRGIHDVRGTES